VARRNADRTQISGRIGDMGALGADTVKRKPPMPSHF